MRRLLAAVLVLLAVVACSPGPPRGGKQSLPGPVPASVTYCGAQGAAAPNFTLSLVDGTPVSAAELWRDRPVVLVFFSTWCGQCGQSQKDFSALAAKYRDVVSFLGVAGRDALTSYLDEHEVAYPVGRDDEQQTAGRRFALREPPLVAVVAKGGTLVRGWPGGTTAPTVEAELTKLITR